jgi:NitT/TauT family transport system substrate-binding protein
MSRSPPHRFDRRRFLAGASALGVASVLGSIREAAAEPPPEITKIRLVRAQAVCLAPQYLAEELLAMEGFTDVEYVQLTEGNLIDKIEQGHADLTMDSAPAVVYGMETHSSVIALAGIHAGCYELFGNERVHSIRDLKGKTISIVAIGAGDHVLLASMLAYVGIDPRKDVNWIFPEKFTDTMRLFVEGKADAFIGFPPQPQELRAKKMGRVIVNTAQDRPWSHHFCCILSGNREFVRKYPVATKRAIRAYLKAADICAQDPARAARFMVDRGIEPRYDIGLEVIKDVPYRRWREADPEDTLLFYALRLHEVGMIKESPRKLVTRGADWRFFNELKQELKA